MHSFDTAENERSVARVAAMVTTSRNAVQAPPPMEEEEKESGGVVMRPRRGDTTTDPQNFGKMLLVFGCIGSDFCKKTCVLQHFSKSTRFSSWNLKFDKILQILRHLHFFLLKFHENC